MSVGYSNLERTICYTKLLNLSLKYFAFILSWIVSAGFGITKTSISFQKLWFLIKIVKISQFTRSGILIWFFQKKSLCHKFCLYFLERCWVPQVVLWLLFLFLTQPFPPPSNLKKARKEAMSLRTVKHRYVTIHLKAKEDVSKSGCAVICYGNNDKTWVSGSQNLLDRLGAIRRLT